MSSPVPTLAEVGRRVGVSAATACLALRKDPRISLPTQKKVQQAARELNYVPDPLLSALVARRDRNRPHKVFANVAALVDDRWAQCGRQNWQDTIIRSMESTCRRLGYSLEVLRLQHDLRSSPDRILHARGIRALVFLPLRDNALEINLDWNQYVIVTVGSASFLSGIADRVGSDSFAGMQIVCDKIAELGYRRVGLAHTHDSARMQRYAWLGALSKEHFLKGSRLRVTTPYMPEVMSKESFLGWAAKEKPECVVTNDRGIMSWLRDGGWRVPQDIGLALLVHGGEDQGVSGVAPDLELCGKNAIDQLHISLLHGETGFPEHPKVILTYPHWVEGSTVRRLEQETRETRRKPEEKRGRKLLPG